MTKTTFSYLWEQGIAKAAQNVYDEIKKESNDWISNYNVKLDLSQNMYNKLFEEYDKLRKRVRARYFDAGENDQNLIDGHKICACITGALLETRLITFNTKMKNVPKLVYYSNYAIAFLAGIYVQYLFLLSDYKRNNENKLYDCLKEQATFYFPETNEGHDSYISGRIKTLALNDIYGNDFDVLTYADMLFWIEKYNKDIISRKILCE